MCYFGNNINSSRMITRNWCMCGEVLVQLDPRGLLGFFFSFTCRIRTAKRNRIRYRRRFNFYSSIHNALIPHLYPDNTGQVACLTRVSSVPSFRILTHTRASPFGTSTFIPIWGKIVAPPSNTSFNYEWKPWVLLVLPNDKCSVKVMFNIFTHIECNGCESRSVFLWFFTALHRNNRTLVTKQCDSIFIMRSVLFQWSSSSTSRLKLLFVS